MSVAIAVIGLGEAGSAIAADLAAAGAAVRAFDPVARATLAARRRAVWETTTATRIDSSTRQ